MTALVEIDRLAKAAGLPLHAKHNPMFGRCGIRSRYLLCLPDGTEYASVESVRAAPEELARLLKLYGPTLKGRSR